MNKSKHLPFLFLFFILLIFTAFSFYLHCKAGEFGTDLGKSTGTRVGTAIGSANGITVGLKEGWHAGEEAGLSAEDTVVDVERSIANLGKLEVLTAGVSLKNINKISDDYAGLYLIKGTLIFTVNLEESEISFSQDGKNVYITIPQPEYEIALDQSSTEKLAESQHFSWSVTAKDGLMSVLNTMKTTEEKLKESLASYDSLLQDAKDSAIKQVNLLATMICGDKYVVHVQFK